MTVAGAGIEIGDQIAVGPPLLSGPGVAAGPGVVLPGSSQQITDVSQAPIGAPVVLVRGTDGLFRPDAAPIRRAIWGDPIRFRAGAPTADPAAPEGAIHIDTTTGRGYRLREET